MFLHDLRFSLEGSCMANVSLQDKGNTLSHSTHFFGKCKRNWQQNRLLWVISIILIFLLLFIIQGEKWLTFSDEENIGALEKWKSEHNIDNEENQDDSNKNIDFNDVNNKVPPIRIIIIESCKNLNATIDMTITTCLEALFFGVIPFIFITLLFPISLCEKLESFFDRVVRRTPPFLVLCLLSVQSKLLEKEEFAHLFFWVILVYLSSDFLTETNRLRKSQFVRFFQSFYQGTFLPSQYSNFLKRLKYYALDKIRLIWVYILRNGNFHVILSAYFRNYIIYLTTLGFLKIVYVDQIGKYLMQNYATMIEIQALQTQHIWSASFKLFIPLIFLITFLLLLQTVIYLWQRPPMINNLPIDVEESCFEVFSTHKTKELPCFNALVTLHYQDNLNHTLKEMNVVLYPNEVNVLFGVSGCGKTSLARGILGYTAPCLASTKITPKEQKLSEYTSAFVAQKPYEGLSQVFENELVLDRIAKIRWPENINWKEFNEKVRWWEFTSSISTLLLTPIENLSGGERQKLLFLFVAFLKPQIMALDEPTASLDQRARAKILEYLNMLQKHGDTTIIAISHDYTFINGLLGKENFFKVSTLKEYMKEKHIIDAQKDTNRIVFDISGVVKRISLDRFIFEHAKLPMPLRGGRCFVLKGANGSGKSTLFNIITGWETSKIEMLQFCGISLSGRKIFHLFSTEKSKYQLLRRFNSTIILQNQDCLNPKLTIEESLAVESEDHAAKCLLNDDKFKQLKNTIQEHRQKLLSILGLEHTVSHTANAISVGQQKRLNLLRSLLKYHYNRELLRYLNNSNHPQEYLLLIDEISSGNGAKYMERIVDILRDLITQDNNLGILVIDHDDDFLNSICTYYQTSPNTFINGYSIIISKSGKYQKGEIVENFVDMEEF